MDRLLPDPARLPNGNRRRQPTTLLTPLRRRGGRVERTGSLRRGPSRAKSQWRSEVDDFVEGWRRKRLIGERWTKGLRYTLGRIPLLLAETEPDLRLESFRGVTEAHLAALRTRGGWGRATKQFYLAALRLFLRWHGSPLASESDLWRLPEGAAPKRRWLTGEELAHLLRHASGRARLIVALEGFNGLRRVEVLRLRAMDVNLEEGWINVHGKGRMGGKWRQIPLSSIAREELRRVLGGTAPEARILPYSASWADQKLTEAARAAGFERRAIRVSHHDLRRTFGRVAHSSGMDLVQLKNLFGHSNLEMSIHYIGLDLDRMREGISRIDRAFAPLVSRGTSRGAGPRVGTRLRPLGV
jgi:integrase